MFSVFIGLCFLSTGFCDELSPGKQVPQELKLDTGETISYLLYLPAQYDSKGPWPLLLFLHGRGESKPPLDTVKKWGPPRLIERGENFPYIIASPQCPPAPRAWSDSGEQALLLALIDHLSKTAKVDPDRIYLTGASMGGSGSWHLAAAHPELFAAVIPICGHGDTNDAEKLKNLPIWVWHGTEDKAVTIQGDIDMVAAIKSAGGSTIRLTTLEGIGHNSWEAAYASPDLYEWLNKQSASKNRKRVKQ